MRSIDRVFPLKKLYAWLILFSGCPTVFAVQASVQVSDTAAATDSITVSRNDTVTRLERIRVTAGKYDQLMNSTVSVSLIKPQMWEGTGKSLADVIAEQPGIQTRRFGGRGSFQTVSLRGVEGSEVLILLDGIPLNNALGDAVDLGKINPMLFQSVEVYRSFIPARFGGNGLGGAINLITAQPDNTGGADIHAQIGNYHTWNHHLMVRHTQGTGYSVLGLLSFEHSDNDFHYLDRNNTVLPAVLTDPTLDDTVRIMDNNQYSAGNLLLHPSFDVGRKMLHTTFSTTWYRSHIPANEGTVNRTAYATEKITSVNCRLVSLSDARLQVMPSAGYIFRDGYRFTSSLDDGVGASHATLNGPDSYRKTGAKEHAVSFPVEGYYRHRKWLHIESLVMLTGNDINPTASGTGGHGDWHSSEACASAAVDVHFDYNTFTFLTGGSAKGIRSRTEGGLDSYTMKRVPEGDTMYAVWSLKGGATAALLDSSVRLFLNGGRFSNHPSLRQRYGAQGAHNPNPTLRPEYGYAGELGGRYRRGKLFGEVCAFYNRSYDKIMTVFDGRESASINCSGARVYGAELSLILPVRRWFSTDSRITLQQTENLAEQYNWYGRRLPGEPDITIRETVQFNLPCGISLDYGAVLRSFYYRNPANNEKSDRVPRYEAGGKSAFWEIRHNAKLLWKPVRHLKVMLSAVDITNQMLTEGEVFYAGESSYSWTLVPANRFSVTCNYSF